MKKTIYRMIFLCLITCLLIGCGDPIKKIDNAYSKAFATNTNEDCNKVLDLIDDLYEKGRAVFNDNWDKLSSKYIDILSVLMSNNSTNIYGTTVMRNKYSELLSDYPEHSALIREVCKKKRIYGLGLLGEAGGYIFYDCDADNTSGNADGLVSSECGWRYLEAAPYDLSYTLRENDDGSSTYVIGCEAGQSKTFPFGYYRTIASGNNLYVNGTTTYLEEDCTREEVGTGKANTELLVSAMGERTYSLGIGSDITILHAANLADYVSVNGYDDWFLPSKDELDLMYDNLRANGIGSFFGDDYWSSSESYVYVSSAWYQDFSDGRQDYISRSCSKGVRPCRAFKPLSAEAAASRAYQQRTTWAAATGKNANEI